MLRELLVSVASGIIVALVLGLFRRGGQRAPRRYEAAVRYDPPPRRGSFLGGLLRLSLAVGGGIAFAYAVAPVIFGRRFWNYGGYGRFNRFDGRDGFDGMLSHAPMIVLTVVGTVVVWGLLSALRRR